MNSEDCKLIDNAPIDDSIFKRNYLKICHQQGTSLNDPDQNVEFISGKNNYYRQVGNAYLEFDITVRDPTASFNKNAEKRLVNNGFAFCF